jgi:hypothetical protein
MSPIFRPGAGPYALAVAMTGVRLGERLLYIGSGTPGMFAALAAKVGMSGLAAGVASDKAGAAALEQAGARAGVLVEVRQAGAGTLSYDAESFDLVVLDEGAMQPRVAGAWLPDALRALRAGGRLILAERVGATGLRALFCGATSSSSPPRATVGMLEMNGFRPVRVIAERDGWRFTEGMKSRG